MFITRLSQKIEDWASRQEIVYKYAMGYYRDVIEKEVVLANITENDKILCIGGGICPFSAILFHQETGAGVTVIDNNKKCVSKAREVIGRLGLDKYVSVFCCDGACPDIDFSEFTIIHFAMQVFPIDSVFSHVEQNVCPGTKLLVRVPKNSLRKLYSHNQADLPSPLLNACPLTAHKNARNIGSTLLYIKQEDDLEKEMEMAVGVNYTPVSCHYPVAV